MKIALTVLALSVLIVACGDKTEPAASGGAAPAAPKVLAGDTPKATFETFKAAMIAKDGRTVYDILAPDGRKDLEKEIGQIVDMVEGKPIEGMGEMTPEVKAQMLAEMKDDLGFDPNELKGLSMRDAFAKLAAGSKDKGSERAERAVYESEKIDGDKAVVTYKDGDKTETMEMVKVDGKWYVANLK